MAETAAHLADHVLPRLPVRQWVLSVPKRLRPHRSSGAAPTHPPAPLLRRAGTELAAARTSHGHGAASTRPRSRPSPACAARANCCGRQRTVPGWCGPAAGTRTRQALTRALPVGGVDRQNLRGVPTDVPDLCRVGKCASSRSSPMVPRCARFWRTSGRTPKHPASPRRAGHHCGRTAVRRWRGCGGRARLGHFGTDRTGLPGRFKRISW